MNNIYPSIFQQFAAMEEKCAKEKEKQNNNSINNDKKVENIISQLNSLNDGDGVDGETMQYILQQTGMEWQMLRQLMLTMPIIQVEYLIEERKDLGL